MAFMAAITLGRRWGSWLLARRHPLPAADPQSLPADLRNDGGLTPAVRQALARHRGNEIDTAGDGFLAVFALPSDAVLCADEIRSDAATQGLRVRAGMHAGEVVTQPSGVLGVAVHVAARVAAWAQPGEVLLTETVHTLTMGAGLEYETAGEHQLKGIPGTWRLYRLRSKR